MARPITPKKIQIHRECICGFNSVQQEVLQIRFIDFKKLEIKRIKDKKTKKSFYLMQLKSTECHCDNEY